MGKCRRFWPREQHREAVDEDDGVDESYEERFDEDGVLFDELGGVV